MAQGRIYSGNSKPQEATYSQDRPGANTSDVTTNLNFTPVNTTQPKPITDLPKKIPGKIDWLGSSYSGADIKAVVHTYNNVGGQLAALRDLNNQKLAAEATSKMLGNYINGGVDRFIQAKLRNTTNPDFTYDKQVNTWLAIGLGTPEGSVRGDNNWIPTAADLSLPSTLQAQDTAIFYLYQLNTSRSINPIIQAMTIEKQGIDSFLAALEEKISFLNMYQNEATNTITIGTLQTISVQTHREKFGARALGRSYVKGYTRGPRTIAGSMVFTVFNEHALGQLIRGIGNPAIVGESKLDTNLSTLIPDQLPPLDITLVYANEYGSLSRQSIYGVEFVNDGQTMSIEDLFTEEVMNFVARDVDIMTSVGRRKLSQAERGLWTTDEGKPLEGTELLRKTLFGGGGAYKDYLVRLGVRRSFRGR